jgi:tRNA pseudouridine55 synthase
VDVDGILLYDKPAGITSHDVVAGVRRRLGRGVKVGHAGTLDPFATGLLIVLVGRGTRTQRFFMALGKRYEAVARFGAVSTTGDPEGDIVATGVVPEGDLMLPVGRIRQRPPAYSAVKVDGRRASGDRRGFVIECSSGTYVRSLIADLGDAYCEELRRTAIGEFEVADADPERVIGLDQALAGFMPECRLGEEDAVRASHGVAVPGEGAGIVRLTDSDGLIALAEPGREPGTLKPVVGLRPSS